MLDADFVAETRRRRYTDALAELCAERGFATTTVGQIVERAGTSRNTFYDVFPNREEVFLDLLKRASREFLAALDTQAEGEAALEERLRSALEWVAANSAAASALLIEAPCGGQKALEMQVALIDALGDRFALSAGEASVDLCLMCAGAATTLVRGELLALRSAGVPALAGELASLVEDALAPRSLVTGRRA